MSLTISKKMDEAYYERSAVATHPTFALYIVDSRMKLLLSYPVRDIVDSR